jgi:hypothetical protein
VNSKLRKIIIIYIIFSALVLSTSATDKSEKAVKRQIISSGGGNTGASEIHHLSGAFGQPVAGCGISTGHSLGHGFLRGIITAPCDCRPGDVNDDSTINIFDASYLISYLYIEGPPPSPYQLCSGDPNHDCDCNIFDITYLIDFLYRNGPLPATCEDWTAACGQLSKK